MTWNLNDINPPESEAVQAEREIVEAIVANLPAADECDRCRAKAELYHDEASGLALCDSCSTAADIPTHFKRLRNRAWGVTGPSALVREGETVTVTKRDGTSTTVTVGRVLWSDESKAIATITK